MSVPVIITPEAEQDMAEGRDWYERQKYGLRDEFVAAVGDVFERLEANPKMHQIVRKDVRQAVVTRFPWVVFYRALADRTLVIAVHDPPRPEPLAEASLTHIFSSGHTAHERPRVLHRRHRRRPGRRPAAAGVRRLVG